MAWNDDPDHPFAGIAEKLRRADQNIINLQSEIDTFIQSGEYPVIPYPNAQGWQEAATYHRDKPIPLRFAVLTGETVHHLRSCLDHVVWHFSDDEARKIPGSIEFPIFEIKPSEKKEIERYARKIKGIANAKVLSLIEDMQPYKVGADASNHSFLILHDMDRFDKHRELVIVASSVDIAFPPDRPDLIHMAQLYTQGKLPAAESLALSRALQHNSQHTPSVAFREFGQ
jgi:hypothetical protein